MELVYTAMYFVIFGPLGLYVMSRTPVWYFHTDGMFEGLPYRAHEGLFKAYYLLQVSYWAQQFIVLVLGLEKPSDFPYPGEIAASHPLEPFLYLQGPDVTSLKVPSEYPSTFSSKQAQHCKGCTTIRTLTGCR